MSHDFVEAVLLQRAGWGVHMVPSVAGSFEGVPPSLAALVVRDRRWAQGNLQHGKIITKPGLTPMGRVHLAMGIFSYVVSAIWAASLVVGIVLALQGQQIIPSYFQDSKTLFPIWPVIDPGAAMRLFLATMAVVLLPKWLGMVLEIKRSYSAGELFGTPRAIAGVTIETLFSMLLAPILMMTQTAAIVQIWLGRRFRLEGADPRRRRDLAERSPALALAAFSAWRRIAVLCWETSARLARLDVAGDPRPHPLRLRPLADRATRRPGPCRASLHRRGTPARPDPAPRGTPHRDLDEAPRRARCRQRRPSKAVQGGLTLPGAASANSLTVLDSAS